MKKHIRNKIGVILFVMVSLSSISHAYEDGRIRKYLCPITLPATTYTVTAPVCITRSMICDDPLDADLELAQADGGDIRFVTDTTEATQLPLEIVAWAQHSTPASATALFWVGPVTRTAGQATTIYMAYGMAEDGIRFTGGQAAKDSGYTREDVWDGYLAVWHLEESGALVPSEYKDSSANRLHGVGGGTDRIPTRVDGKNGYGQEGDGTNDFINIGTTSLFDFGADNFTIMSWYKPTLVVANARNAGIVQLGGGSAGANNRAVLWYAGAAWAGDSGAFGVITYSGTSKYTPQNTSSNLDDGNWHHAAVVRNGNYFRLYQDGAEYGSGTDVTGVSVTPTTTMNTICTGSAAAAGDYVPCPDPVDEVWIYDGALSDEEIYEIYTQTNSPSGTPGTVILSGRASGYFANVKTIAGGGWDNVGGIDLADVAQFAGIRKPIWHVRPAGGSYGTEDGTSYENAFDGEPTWAVIGDLNTIYYHGDAPVIINGATDTIPNGLVIRGDDATYPHAFDGRTTINNASWVNVTGNIYKVAIKTNNIDHVDGYFPASPSNGDIWRPDTYTDANGTRNPRMMGRGYVYNSTTAKWEESEDWYYRPYSVYVDDTRVDVSRYPDPGLGNTNGFLIADSYSGKTTLADTTIQKADNYWIGTEITALNAMWWWNTRIITDSVQSTSAIVYGAMLYNMPNTYTQGQYYLENLPYAELDEEFEWSVRTESGTTYLYMYMTDETAQTVKYTSENYGAFVQYATNIKLQGLNISHTNDCGILAQSCSGIDVDDCTVIDAYPQQNWFVYGGITITSENYLYTESESYYNGTSAVPSVAFPYRHGAAITNCTISYVQNGPAIEIMGINEFFIEDNTISQIGNDDDFPKSRAGGMENLYCKDGLIDGNTIDWCGYMGILGTYIDTTISNNTITNLFTQNADGGGIYTAQYYSTGNTFTGNNVGDFHIDKFSNYDYCGAYYLDYGSTYNVIDDNVACDIVNTTAGGYSSLIKFSDASYNTATNNTVYGTYGATVATYGTCTKNTTTNNVFSAGDCPF